MRSRLDRDLDRVVHLDQSGRPAVEHDIVGAAADLGSDRPVTLGHGTLYGAIARLEERGWIEPAGAPGRGRPYELNGAGAAVRESTLIQLQAIVEARAAAWPARAVQVAAPAGLA